ncbi:MAG: tetratricopeptide (TPR) repeat protein [Candidatus Aldehydirespiratoraceae bacterium]|jgi:tetratricopeptide (TPR) repeat protein
MTDLQTTRTEERDFLLASLDDLEAEFGAGDLDEADYLALKSDYTTRAARVLRSIERTAPPERSAERDWKRIALWTALIVIVAGLAGVWIAEFSGTRGIGEVGSGSTRGTTRERLFAAQQRLGTEPDEARSIYDEILVDEPSNAEALAYRGWLTHLGGNTAEAASFLERARLSDSTYPDALVFSAVVALELDNPTAASAHIATLDDLDVPPFINQLVSGQGLRIRIAETLLGTGESDSFVSSGLSVVDVEVAAFSVIESDPLRGAQLLGELAAQLPEDPDARAALGAYNLDILFIHGPQFEAAGGDEVDTILAAAERELTVALDLEPTLAVALVYRSFVLYSLDDLNGARRDLAAYDALDTSRGDLDSLITNFGLRDVLA